MEFPWLDLPFTFVTLLLATRLAYDYYGVVAATFAGSFSLQIFLFYCFARWYRHTMAVASVEPRLQSIPQQREEDGGAPPVLAPLLDTATPGAGTAGSLLASRCLAVVFMVFVPLVIVVFERSQADVVAYVLCLANIIVMAFWLSPDSTDSISAAKSFLGLSDDDDDDGSGSGGTGAEEDAKRCCVCLASMREEQALRELPRCGHQFHEKCIGKWLRAQQRCPVCRASAVQPPSPPPPAGFADPLVDSISPV